MNTTEGLLAAGGGAVAGVLLGSLVLAPAREATVYAAKTFDDLKEAEEMLRSRGFSPVRHKPAVFGPGIMDLWLLDVPSSQYDGASKLLFDFATRR